MAVAVMPVRLIWALDQVECRSVDVIRSRVLAGFPVFLERLAVTRADVLIVNTLPAVA